MSPPVRGSIVVNREPFSTPVGMDVGAEAAPLDVAWVDVEALIIAISNLSYRRERNPLLVPGDNHSNWNNNDDYDNKSQRAENLEPFVSPFWTRYTL